MLNEVKSAFGGKKFKAFTLIELLVVAALMITLFTVATVNYERAKVKSRDAQRKTDISRIALAFNSYYTDNKKYVIGDAAHTGFTDISFNWTNKLDSYLPTIPTDPSSGDQYLAKTTVGDYKIVADSEGIASAANGDSPADAQRKAGDYYDPADQTRFQISTSELARAW